MTERVDAAEQPRQVRRRAESGELEQVLQRTGLAAMAQHQLQQRPKKAKKLKPVHSRRKPC